MGGPWAFRGVCRLSWTVSSLIDDPLVWVNEEKTREEGHTFGRSVVILIRVNRPFLFVPVIHSIIVVPINTVIYDEIVLSKATLDDALELFLGYLIVEGRILLWGPRPTATLARTL